MKKFLGFITAATMLAAGMPVSADTILDSFEDVPSNTETEIPIDESIFPDANFRAYVKETFDKDGDGCITASETEGGEVRLNDRTDITSVKGLRFLKGITLFIAERCTALTEVDASRLTDLTCFDVSECTSLKSINLFGNRKLESIWMRETLVESIDLSTLVNLECITAIDSALKTIDVSSNTKLTTLNIGGTDVAEVDLSKNIELLSVSVSRCENIKSIDVSASSSLHDLAGYSSGLTEVILGSHPELNRIDLELSEVQSIDVSGCTAMVSLDLAWTPLKNIDLSKNTALAKLDVSYTHLNKLDLSSCPNMKWLYIQCTGISEMDFSHTPKLIKLYMYEVPMGYTDLSCLSDLEEFYGRGSFAVTVPERSFDLAAIMGKGFDISRVSGVTNGTLSGTTLTVTDTSSPVKYNYATKSSNSEHAEFSVTMKVEVNEGMALKGDVNLDGKTDIKDAAAVLAYYANISAGNSYVFHADSAANDSALTVADVDGDGKISLSDSKYILAYYAGSGAGLSPSWNDIIK